MSHQKPSPELPRIEVGVDADTINEEKCVDKFEDRYSAGPHGTVLSAQASVFINDDVTILPSQYWPGKYDTAMERLFHKKFARPELCFYHDVDTSTGERLDPKGRQIG